MSSMENLVHFDIDFAPEVNVGICLVDSPLVYIRHARTNTVSNSFLCFVNKKT
jgi:hypothetical protein